MPVTRCVTRLRKSAMNIQYFAGSSCSETGIFVSISPVPTVCGALLCRRKTYANKLNCGDTGQDQPDQNCIWYGENSAFLEVVKHKQTLEEPPDEVLEQVVDYMSLGQSRGREYATVSVEYAAHVLTLKIECQCGEVVIWIMAFVMLLAGRHNGSGDITCRKILR